MGQTGRVAAARTKFDGLDPRAVVCIQFVAVQPERLICMPDSTLLLA